MFFLFKYELRICCKMEKIKIEIFVCFYNGLYMIRIVYFCLLNIFIYLIIMNVENVFLFCILKENSLCLVFFFF